MAQGVVQEKVTNALHGALSGAKAKGQLKMESWPTVMLDAPKRPEWGDLATTVAMVLAATEKRAPREIAQIIVDNLPAREQLFERVEIVQPGFLNLTVKPAVWLEVLLEIEQQGEAYGRADLGRGRRVLVEYVSANPTGPLHVGHGRGAAVGHAIVNMLKAVGYDAMSEYYINDAGRQMKLLGASVYARYRELFGQPTAFPEDGYHGGYIQAVAEHIRQAEGDRLLALPPDEAEQRCREVAYRDLLGAIKDDLRVFGIDFDFWCSEATLIASGVVEQSCADLKRQNLLFEEDGALWFRSSNFGDEKDRVVRKQDGEWTYLASDIAYHRDKLLRGYDLLIDVWGADHHGYIPRMQAVMEAYGRPKDTLRVVLVQLVKLLRGGVEVKMSKRTGDFVTMREVIDEVGADAAKFYFLTRDSKTHLEFDLELAKQRSADNPVYYVHYAHARIASLWRVAESRGIARKAGADTDLSVLTDPDELGLIRKLSAFPDVLQASATAFEPHRITYYLQQLAGLLHTFYNKHRILPPAGGPERDGVASADPLPPSVTAARMVLLGAVQQVLRNGLHVLGLSAPDQM